MMKKYQPTKIVALAKLTLASVFVCAVTQQGLAQTPSPAPKTTSSTTAATPAKTTSTAGITTPTPSSSTSGSETMAPVVVTGSYLPTSAAEVGPSPIAYVKSTDVEKVDASDLLETLSKLDTSFTGNGNLGRSNANIASNDTIGGAFVQIHNLPTLVLLDGQRIGNSPVAITQGNVGVDVNLIPDAAIDHVEILKDGASSAYGSDAIAGVVNVIMKDNYNGAEVTGHYGFSTRSDVGEYETSAVGGYAHNGTDIFAGIQYYQIDPLYSRDRDISSPSGNARFGGSIPDGAGGTETFAGVVDNEVTGTAYLLKGATPGALGAPVGAAATAQDPASLPGVYGVNPIPSKYDLSQQTTQALGQTRYNAFARFSQDFYDKRLNFFGDFLYSQDQSFSQLNAQPLLTVAGVVIPAGAPYNPFNVTFDGTGANLGTAANPEALIARDRATDLGPRQFISNSSFYRIVTGFKGDFDPDYHWSMTFDYNENDTGYDTYNLVVTNKLNQAIAGTLTDSSGNLLPAYNFFAQPGQNSSATENAIKGVSTEEYVSTFYNFNPVITATPVTLPAGPLETAIGGELRHEVLQFNDDSLTQSPNGFIDSTPTLPTSGHRETWAVFGELNIPILNPGYNLPGAYSLNLDAGGRFESFSDVGHSGVPKISFTYQPYDDTVTIRGSYSQGFEAPGLGQLSGPSSSGSTNPLFLTGIDGSTTGGNQGNIVATTNPGLKPATSESWTAGVVYSPKFAPGLSLHWDYYRTRYKGYVIDSPNVAAALQSVENLGPKSPYANIVALNAAAGTPGATPITAPGQVVSGVNAGNLYITQSLANAGVLDLDGFDTGFNYESPMTDFGKFTFTSDCDFYFDYRASAQEGLREYSYLGQYTNTAIDNNGQGTIPQFRFNSTLQWDYKGWTAFGNMNFTPGVEDLAELAPAIGGTFSESTANGQAYHVNSYTTFDTALSYEFGRQKMMDSKKDRPLPINECTWYDGIVLTAGSKNVGDTKAPFVPSASNDNTDLATYDTLGRFIYFDITKKF